jgi:hypothetical protein
VFKFEAQAVSVRIQHQLDTVTESGVPGYGVLRVVSLVGNGSVPPSPELYP